MEAVGGRWPTDICEAQADAMMSRLRTAEPGLETLRSAVAAERHPWGWALLVITLAGAAGAGLGLGQDAPAGWAVLCAAVLAIVPAAVKYRREQRELDTERGALDTRLLGDVLQVRVSDASPDALAPYDEAGFLGSWEDAPTLIRIRHDGRQAVFAHLTRTESSTDGKGNTTHHTVTVFRGLLFKLPFPDMASDARMTLARGGRIRPVGRFARKGTGGRKRKLRAIDASSPEFERLFDVRTDDPVTGHAVLDPDRVMRLINLHHDIAQMLGQRRAKLQMLVTQGSMWVAVPGLPALDLTAFPEGPKLERALLKAHHTVCIPSVMAHHLRLPERTTS